MRKYDLLIFDWDGTLVDSIDRIVQSVWMAAKICNLPQRDESAVKGIIGLAMPQAIKVLYPHLTEQAQIAHFLRVYAEHYLAFEETPSPFYPGVATTLELLRDQGYRLAVATGKTRRGLNLVMGGHGWTDFFDATRCADETASKPDPLMLNEILVQCDVEPAKAIMVGDSIFDLQMAEQAGIDAVAVSYGAQDSDRLQSCRFTLMIDRFEQLAIWLASGKC
ncbi:HAD-IA family hydrolase [Azomonas macrocytogenes]|uniref:Phosphoglycolate phosphatase n=1 Tax=Azomonas macrocytogenes TaxID=69962 RepID=A0A839SWW5_AZOMA|nr:phosphoglycolate phosphatase [Azomonas macrocytogenes]